MMVGGFVNRCGFVGGMCGCSIPWQWHDNMVLGV